MILHVDMDAFYASVEERERPELREQPVVVGGTPDGRGVVCAANYRARRYGIHSAMPAATAHRLCPHAVFLRPRMECYAGVSRQIREIFGRFTPLVEPLSLDEAFLDVTGSTRLFGAPTLIGQTVKQTIRNELGLVASVGVAPNKYLAKIASDLEKPDGFVVVDPDRVDAFLDPLPVGRIWGVGRAASRTLSQLGIERIGQLKALSVELLSEHFGRSGPHLWKLAHGIDERQVVPDHRAKSMSHETTFATDVEDSDVLRGWLMELTEQVARRLRRHGLRGRTVNLKVRYHDFQTFTRAKTLDEATYETQMIWRTAEQILRTRLPNRPLRIRLLGVGVSGIEQSTTSQQLLFEEPKREREKRLDAATDAIKDRFGSKAVGRGLHRDRERGKADELGSDDDRRSSK
jgi:DNA polymerase-4